MYSFVYKVLVIIYAICLPFLSSSKVNMIYVLFVIFVTFRQCQAAYYLNKICIMYDFA